MGELLRREMMGGEGVGLRLDERVERLDCLSSFLCRRNRWRRDDIVMGSRFVRNCAFDLLYAVIGC